MRLFFLLPLQQKKGKTVMIIVNAQQMPMGIIDRKTNGINPLSKSSLKMNIQKIQVAKHVAFVIVLATFILVIQF